MLLVLRGVALRRILCEECPRLCEDPSMVFSLTRVHLALDLRRGLSGGVVLFSIVDDFLVHSVAPASSTDLDRLTLVLPKSLCFCCSDFGKDDILECLVGGAEPSKITVDCSLGDFVSLEVIVL